MAKIMTWAKIGWALWLVAAMGVGCETATMDNQGTITLAELQGITPEPVDTGVDTGGETDGDADADTGGDADGDADGGTETDVGAGDGTATGGTWPSEITGSIKWLNTDVSGWSQTASLSASVSGSTINMPYDKARVWPTVDGVNANCWAIVNIGGQWYAATFEYLRPGQTSKPKAVLDGSLGDHFKVSPLSGWHPSSGERFGVMVSGLARGGLRNVKERSNISMVTWP